MKSFYDKMLVDKANALAKKYGSKVEQRNALSSGYEAVKSGGSDKAIAEFKTKADADHWVKMMNGKNPIYEVKEKPKQSIHYLHITSELRQKAKESFPLFSTSPTLTAVQHDPFQQQDQNKKYKLIPIQGNPFQ